MKASLNAATGLSSDPRALPLSWPCFERVEVLESGKTLGVLVRERDGSVSAVRISVDQIAD